MRCHQLDGVTIRPVKHHGPLAVDGDLNSRRGTPQSGRVYRHSLNVIHAIGKPWRLQLPRACLGVGFHLTRGQAID